MDKLDDQPFIILEWVAGEQGKGADLRGWLRGGPLDLRAALDVTIDICRGLIHAQTRQPGLVHRDLKPENVLVAQGKVAKITDFGLASLVQQTGLQLAAGPSTTSGRHSMIGASGVVGTPPYMAPEQWRGEVGDIRTDIYAVGCILYEVLTGTWPYQATTLSDFQRLHTTAALPVIADPESFSPAMNVLLARCLAKSPDDRFADVAALLDALTQLYRAHCGGEPRSMPPIGTFTSADNNDRGATYYQLGRYDDAVADYDRAIQLDPTDARVYFNRGFAYSALKRYDKALADYDHSLQLDATVARTYFDRGAVYMALKRYDQALADYSRAIELDPAYAEAYSNRGAVYMLLDRYDEALADYDRAIQLDPDSPNVYFYRGTVYDNLSLYDEALADYTRALERDPALAQVYANRGEIFLRLERDGEAAADYTRAIELGLANVNAYYNRGGIFHDWGRYTQALADYAEAITLDPSFFQAYLGRGLTYFELKRYDEALSDYTRAIALNPTYAKAYNNRGLTDDELGRYDQAAADYKRAIEIQPTHVNACMNLGELLERQGKLREALPYFERAAQLGDPDGRADAARLRKRLGLAESDGRAVAQQAFEAFQRADSRKAMWQAAAQYPLLTDPQFIAIMEQAIAEQVPPDQSSAFEQRLAWLREIPRIRR